MNITDPADVAQTVDGADVVVHLAAIIPPGSMRDPDLAERVNVGGTRNVIEACRAAEAPPRIVYSSSLALFGPTQHQAPPRRGGSPIPS